MSKSLSRTTAEALGPLVVPLVTKVALPIAIESLRRGGRFDTDRFYAEAKESLTDRGSELYDDLRKQGAALLETLTEKGSALADGWMERARPRRRRFGLGKALLVLAVVGVGIVVFAGRE